MLVISSRTSNFMSRCVACVLIFGSVLGLAGVSVHTTLTVLNREELRESDDSIRKAFANRDLFTTIEQRIHEHEEMISKLRSPIAKKEEQRNLALLYEELGNRSLGFSQMPRAEEAYQKCFALDPENPKYMGDLANLYASAAVKQAEARQRVSLYRNSSELWQSAATVSNDTNQRTQYRHEAASALVGLASELTRAGLNGEAKHELQTARDLAVDGSPLETQIDQMLSNVRG